MSGNYKHAFQELASSGPHKSTGEPASHHSNLDFKQKLFKIWMQSIVYIARPTTTREKMNLTQTIGKCMEYGHFHPIPKGMQFVAGGEILPMSYLFPPTQSLPKPPLRINTTSVQPPPPPPQSQVPRPMNKEIFPAWASELVPKRLRTLSNVQGDHPIKRYL